MEREENQQYLKGAVKMEAFYITLQGASSEDVQALYTNDIEKIDEWINVNVFNTLVKSLEQKEADKKLCLGAQYFGFVDEPFAIGLDIEWKPNRKPGDDHKTAVLQLSVEKRCLVVHLIYLQTLPSSIKSVLEDARVLKVGCGIKDDAIKLNEDTGMRCCGLVDLTEFAKSRGCARKDGQGLKQMARHLLGIEVKKPKKISTSNWECFPLTPVQVNYAALDAWLGFKIFRHVLLKLEGNDVPVIMEQPTRKPKKKKETLNKVESEPMQNQVKAGKGVKGETKLDTEQAMYCEELCKII